MRFNALLLIAALATARAGYGQRPIGKVDPNPIAENVTLSFDINDSPGDDVSPNIVFSRDGSKGFISYPRALDKTDQNNPKRLSGRVVAFDPRTGQVLARIDAGTIDGRPTSPAQMALSPDGKSLAVVNVLGDAIFIIDVDNLALRSTFRFKDATFGFGSNVVFSPDGRFGFIASQRLGTALSPTEGEVIRFNLADGSEAGARVKVGIAPAHLAITPDGATLLAVNTIAREGPDTISIIDVASFSMRGTVKPSDGTSFTFANNIAISPDGSAAAIASSASGRLVIFNPAGGEMLGEVNVGFQPNFVAVSPDGKSFVVLNSGGISLVDIASRQVTISRFTPRGSFKSTNNIVFTKDGTRGFAAAVGLDFVVFSIDLVTGALDTLVALADAPDFNFDFGPSQVAFAPDGEILAAVNFRQNAVFLIKDGVNSDFPFLMLSPDLFTGISLVNLGGGPTEVELTAVAGSGGRVLGEGVENPKKIEVEPGRQLVATVEELFKLKRDQEQNGWITASLDKANMAGLAVIGNLSALALDSVLPLDRNASRRSTRHLLIELVDNSSQDTVKFTQVNIVNPNFNPASVKIKLFNKDGEQVGEERSEQVPARVRFSRFIGELFTVEGGFDGGYLEIASDIGVLAFGLIGSFASVAALEAARPPAGDGETTLVTPLTLTGAFQARLSLVNSGDKDASVTVSLFDKSGRMLGSLPSTLQPRRQLRGNLAELLGLAPAAIAEGWVKIESSSRQVVAALTLVDELGRPFAAAPLQEAALDSAVFAQAVSNDNFITAVSLLNPTAEPRAARVRVFSSDGQEKAVAMFDVAAGQHRLLGLDDLLGAPLDSGYLIVEAQGGIFAQQALAPPSGTHDFFMLIPPQPVR